MRQMWGTCFHNHQRRDPASEGQNLAGVHDAERVEGGLDFAHGFEFGSATPFLHHVGFERADAVFGREAAVKLADDFVDHCLDFVRLFFEGRVVSADRDGRD